MAGKPLPPGSLGLPWIGETLAFVKDSFAFFAERRQKYGPVFKTRLLGEPVVCLTGPDAVSFAGYVPLLERIIRRYLGNWGEEGSLLWVPELQAMCFDAANTLFAGASPDSSGRDAFNAFAHECGIFGAAGQAAIHQVRAGAQRPRRASRLPAPADHRGPERRRHHRCPGQAARLRTWASPRLTGSC